MGMLDLLLGRKQPPAKPRNSRTPPNSTQFVASQLPPGTVSAHSVRKDLLKLVLRETLTRNGIPQPWLAADVLRTTSARRDQGVHVRFLMRVWEPRLLLHGPALEQDFLQRLMLLDPEANDWLMGFSWQFAMEDFTRCPGLPHPGSWTAPPQEDTAPGEDKPITRAGDIIEGPVLIPQPREDVRADLDRLLALRDEDMKRHGDGFAATRPVQL
jgi:hypothetical protein